MEFSQALSCRDGPGRRPSAEPLAFLSSVTIHCAARQAPVPLWPSGFLMHQDEAPLITGEACRAVSSVKTRGHEGTRREGERQM